MLLTFVVLNGSVLLDLLTIYGTQIFWPFDTTPHAFPTLFIIDPLFTLPILIGVSAALFLKNHRLNFIGLSLSLVYLIWALGMSVFIKGKMEDKLNEQGVPYSQFISSPAPLPLSFGERWGFIMTSILRPIILCLTVMHRYQ